MKSYITRLLFAVAWTGAVLTSSCTKDDNTDEIMLDDIVLNFTRTVHEEQINLPDLDQVSNYWHIYAPSADDWVIYERIPGRKSLYVGLEANSGNTIRSSYIMVRSKNYTQRIRINQDNGATKLTLSSTYQSILAAGGTAYVTIEGYDFLSNVEVTVDAASQSWLSVERTNDVLAIKATENPSEEKRTGKITVKAYREISQLEVSAEIEVSQGALGQKPYHIALPLDWTKTWVYTASANGKPIAQICKEFIRLEGTVNAQAIVVYPINDNGDVMLTQGGYVAEVLLESTDVTINPLNTYAYTAPIGNVHGGTVKFSLAGYEADVATNSTGTGSGNSSSTAIPTLNNTTYLSYEPGLAAAAKEIWMLEDQYMIEKPGDAIEAEVTPYLVEDNRGTDDNYTYGVVKIGCQYWLNDNLKTSHWTDGTAIPLAGTGWSTTASTASSYIAVYNPANDTSSIDYPDNRNTYGVCYTYLAIGKYDTTAQATAVANTYDKNIDDKVSPEGWIIPTMSECLTMGAYTGSRLAAGRLEMAAPLAPENNISGFNNRENYYYYNSSGFIVGGNFYVQFHTRTRAADDSGTVRNCMWVAHNTTGTMTKNRGNLVRLCPVRCINNGAISVK